MTFKKALKKVTHSIHLNSHVDETSSETEWHLPRTHFLECWGDTRAVDGTLSVIQPLIEPLFGAHSDVEIIGLLATGKEDKGSALVKESWRQYLKGDFERHWRRVLHDGVLAESSAKEETPGVKNNNVASILKSYTASTNNSKDSMEIVFHPSLTLGDGSQTNNGWLQELPDPITKLSWDNVATFSPSTAASMGIENEDVVRLTLDGRELQIPAWIVPGQADNTVGVTLGYGRTKAGRVGNKVGANAYLLRSSDSLHSTDDLKITNTGRKFMLANTQDHGSMEGRPIVREATIDEYRKHPEFAKEMVEHPPLVSLWKDRAYDKGYQWGMVIDLNACIGCNACTIACQSENNIPIVGKEQVHNGREMHWIRVDRYFKGDKENPEVVHQPVTCHHCENAPCEQVCPVAATVHDKEGLNVMVYNRCIGTRYCSNNCPYKVRRFNFFNYTKDYPETIKMAQNPDVTVRSRGVMEKCTFCLQRINSAKKNAKQEGRSVRDGEIVTACQQACPANAITFGNVNDKDSMVSNKKALDRNYELLAELNTKPRLSYLAKLRNPNPELT
jgi:molybdopterin-containing oxidoreductase family iron-sulfur binding subunit